MTKQPIPLIPNGKGPVFSAPSRFGILEAHVNHPGYYRVYSYENVNDCSFRD